jgi:hypothetical protein
VTLNPTRIVILGILAMALIAGIALYYLQVHAFYTTVTMDEAGPVELTSLHSDEVEEIAVTEFRGIDSISSPIRFRACFDTGLDHATLIELFRMYPGAEPLNAPGWFDCFDARALGAALASGEALAFMGRENIIYGIDRVVAVLPDGQGFAWHQINRCGAAVFNGDPAPDDCPPPPER